MSNKIKESDILIKSEFNEIKNDFIYQCGYSEKDAEIAAKNVILEEQKPSF